MTTPDFVTAEGRTGSTRSIYPARDPYPVPKRVEPTLLKSIRLAEKAARRFKETHS